jgi:hypothetical protein
MNDISKYTSLFHDGSVMYINHVNNEMIIFMESAEVDEEDIDDDIILSKDDRIRGKLHIENIKNIKINNKLFLKTIENTYDDGGIVNFKIAKNSIKLSLDWVNFPPKQKIDEFWIIQIEAEKIWWETIPELHV